MDHRPLGGYAVLIAIYGSLAGSLAWATVKRRRQPPGLSPFDLLMLALATQHVSRLVTKDSITAALRAPFTEFDKPAGEGEVNESPVGAGLHKALGELLTCPFCMSQWVATLFVAGRVLAPRVTSAAVSTFAVARASDYLQLLYGALRSDQ